MLYESRCTQVPETVSAHTRRKMRLRRRRSRRSFAALLLALIVGGALLFLMLSAGEDRSSLFRQPLYVSDPDFSAPRTAYTIPNVPYISQREKYETGCESVSAVMVLNYYGYEITVDEFIDSDLPLGQAPYVDADGHWFGCDPWESFPGDPRTAGGWGCYSTVIESAMNRCLGDSGRHAERLSDVPLDTLCATYIDRNQPVLIWATMEMELPTESITWTVPETGRRITWIYPMHCLVLIGYDADTYIFNDPWSGADIAYDKESVQIAYDALYRQAVVLA
ncbi:MAG: C39 family peptidase [Hominenteromicrobium sp.]